MFKILNSNILDERAKLNDFTFKNGQETGTEFIAL